MKRGISVIMCVVFLVQLAVVSVSAEEDSNLFVTVDTGNGNVQEYSGISEDGEVFLKAQDIADIGGYVCDIGEQIGFSREPGSSFYQFDIGMDGEAHVQGNTYQIEIKKKNSDYYLPLEKVLYLMHDTWCVENGVLYVNTLPYSLLDFFDDFYGDMWQSLTTDEDLLMNGESGLLRSIRSSLAYMVRNLDAGYYIPFWGVNDAIEEDYENILMKLTESDEPYIGQVPEDLVAAELQDTLLGEISEENSHLKFMVDLPLKIDKADTGLTEILEAYGKTDSVACKITKNVDIETFFDKNRLSALSKELGQISDGLKLLNAVCNIADVSKRAEMMNDSFLRQMEILRDFDISQYKGASVKRIKNAAADLIETKGQTINAMTEKTVDEAINILGGSAADLTFAGKAVAVIQTADMVLSLVSEEYGNAMEAATISYMLGQSINLEFISLNEMGKLLQETNFLNYSYSEENARSIREAALLYLDLNLRDKSYIYYLNSINNELPEWEESSQAQDIKQEIARVQAMRAALIATEDSDAQAVLGDFSQMYSDEPGMVREKISPDVLHQKKESEENNDSTIQAETQWQKIYVDYIESIRNEGWAGYDLIYIDEDEIPELYIQGNIVAQGNRLCMMRDSQIITLPLGGDTTIVYIPKSNCFSDSGGYMDSYHDYVYQINEGSFACLGRGEYGAEDNAHVQTNEQGEPLYKYFWNDSQITEEEYFNIIEQFLPAEQVQYAYENIVSADEILEELASGL